LESERSAGHGGPGIEGLVPQLYDELRALAARQMRSERRDHTLEPTALVHEAFLRLRVQERAEWINREQFFAVAARTMRRVLVDAARRHAADKRGGGARRTTLSGLIDGAFEPEVLDVHRALAELETLDPRQARIVELRSFGGLSIEETAGLMEISPATVKREWTSARAWLFRRLTTSSDPGAASSPSAPSK
jgi:RNA polymerase sigma-70 factor (ECF subfamily)